MPSADANHLVLTWLREGGIAGFNEIMVTNNEFNRRGALVSFDFTPYGGDLPRLAEIQFFSEASIRTFLDRCADSGGFCFEGDYPDLEC
jgi:hypothetical protein